MNGGWVAEFQAAISEGRGDAAMELARGSAEALLREAIQLSADAHAVMSEVFITAAGLRRSPADVLGILLHESVHGIAWTRGINDTSRQGRYHNARFRAIADEVGLEVHRDPPFGWCATALASDTAASYSKTLTHLSAALAALPEDLEATARPSAMRLVCHCGERLRPARHGTVRAATCSRCWRGAAPRDVSASLLG